MALQAAERALLGPLHAPYTGQIHACGVARITFRTVSPRRWMNKGKRRKGWVCCHAQPGQKDCRAHWRRQSVDQVLVL